MSFLQHATALIVASVLLLAPSMNTPVLDCVTIVGTCRQIPWKIATVNDVGKVPQSAVDSVITVRLDDKGRTRVLFAFDNPCEYVVTAQTRQMNDTLDVYFKTRRRGAPEVNNDSTPAIYGCPAMISNLGYEVIIPRSTHAAHVIRGLTGNGSAMVTRILVTP